MENAAKCHAEQVRHEALKTGHRPMCGRFTLTKDLQQMMEAYPAFSALEKLAARYNIAPTQRAPVARLRGDGSRELVALKWGLVPDMAGFPLWRGNVRDDVLRELTYTNRIFNGTEAQEMGFATHVSDNPLDDAMALAKQIALKNPDAIKASKRIFNSMQDATDAELLMAESVEQDKITRTPNQMEAVFAEMQKRKPAFTD